MGRTVDSRVPRSGGTAVESVREFGPFYESVTTSAGDSRLSIRPLLYTQIDIPSEDARLREVLWPLYASHERENRFDARFFLAFYRDADTADDTSAYSFWILPFWGNGRAKNGETYAGLFPFYGTVRDFLTYDELSFCLFPVWAATEKAGIRSRHILWPIFSEAKDLETDGQRVHNLRVFPFWGRVYSEGRWDRRFVLWPFWNQATYYKRRRGEDIAPDGDAWMLFPFAAHVDRPTVETYGVVPPFFLFSYGRGKFEGDRSLWAPWPLVHIADIDTRKPDDTRHIRSFYPFFASYWDKTTERGHVLWPIGSYGCTVSPAYRSYDLSIAPLFHRSSVYTNGVPVSILGGAADTEPVPESDFAFVRSYTRFWPLFSHIHENGSTYFRLLDFGFSRREGPLERNLLRMPVLYSHGSEPANDTREDELLWGFFRWRRTSGSTREFQLWPLVHASAPAAPAELPPRKDWSVLLGLFGRETDPETAERKTRLLWFLTF